MTCDAGGTSWTTVNRKHKIKGLPDSAWCHRIIDTLDISQLHALDIKALLGQRHYMAAIVGIREAAERIARKGK